MTRTGQVRAAEAEDTASLDEWPISASDRDHWSFRPLQRPSLPEVAAPDWCRTPVDRFVLRALERRNLRPAPPADRLTLLRRVCFDLVGLPPSPELVQSFQEDTDPGAYERLVDRLLASPQYGERWAQYWLDLARFAETDGFEHDKTRPTAWKYRDWVVGELNADTPYDQFIQYQVAGDVLDPGNGKAAVATAFCLSGPDMPDINSQLERKETLLNEMAGTVGAVFLGLQVGCAQCHNHMFDPISQADFYRLRAFFEPAVAVVRDKPVTTLHTAREEIQPSHLLIRGDWRRRGPTLQAGFPRVVNLADTVVQGTTNSARRAELARWLTRPDHPLTTRVIVNRLWQFHFGHGLSRSPSDFGVMGDAPTHPELLDWLATEFVRAGWRWKAFHRLVVTSSVYRQASRVDVGDPAREAFERSLGDDPGNRWLARFPRRRLEAEAARDAMLAVAGALVDTAGGPGVRPPLPPELLDTLLKNQWETSPDASDHYRRSVYVFARRNLRFPLFAALDRPAANSSCARRQVSTTAPQALVMFNSEFSLTIARHLAGRVWQRAQDAPEQQVDWVCRLGWSRPPTRGERAVMLKFLKSQTHALVAEGRPADQLALPHATGDLAAEDRYAAAALTDLCLAILNTNEFLYID